MTICSISMRGVLPATTMLTLAACGGGGGGSDGPVITPEPLFFGAVDATTSGNGVPFSNPIPVDADVADQAFSVPFLTVGNFGDGEDPEVAVERAVFTPSLEFVSSFGGDVSLEIDGETVVVTRGVGTFADGQSIVLDTVLRGTASIMLGGWVSDDEGFREIYMFPVGLETSPAELAVRGGNATYTGEFSMGGYASSTSGSEVAGFLVEGTSDLLVNFDDSTLSGALVGDLDGTGTAFLDGALQDADISLNGAEGEVVWTCRGTASCDGATSDYAVTFADPEGDEIIGITTLETDIENSGETLSVDFFGGFIATN